MPEFVEQRENLPGLRRAVVDVDDRKKVVVEAEARKAFLAERIFENKDADAVKRLPPFLQRLLGVAPGHLLLELYAEIVAYSCRHSVGRHARGELHVTRNEPFGWIASLSKLMQSDLERFCFPQQKLDASWKARKLGIGQGAESFLDPGHIGPLGKKEHRNRNPKLVRYGFELRIARQRPSGFPRRDLRELLRGFLGAEPGAFTRPRDYVPVDCYSLRHLSPVPPQACVRSSGLEVRDHIRSLRDHRDGGIACTRD